MKTRRHHNNRGERQVRTGKTRTQVKHIAKRLGVTESIVRDVPDHPVAASCTIMYCQLFDLQREVDELEGLRERMGRILSDTADALKGAPKPLSLHSWHDLANVATKLRRALEAIYTMCRADEKGEYWAIRKYLDEHGVYHGNLSTPERLIEEVCKLILKSD